MSSFSGRDDGKMKSKQVVIYVICFLVAFVVTIQMRTVNTNKTDILRLKTENELRDEVNQWKEAYNKLTSKNSELSKKIEEYRNVSGDDEANQELIKKDMEQAYIAAGLLPVHGEGVTIVLDETKALEKIFLDAGQYDSNVFLISSQDILSLINALILNGAEVISVNDQRINNSTAIDGNGPKVQINGVTMAAPYTIKAIGNPEALSSGVYLRGGVIDALKNLQIDIQVTKEEDVIIHDFDESVKYQYAKPYEVEEDV